ncbi:heme-binding protein [Tamlana sp. 2_MG-2023]|uniref:GlcG/HbpS family heme-binding protein n=1 Tax=unclassified Tamlana TaxID=2614803 RepID=UPI0026E11617|nr:MULTISPECIES: heme-binding protein [unclassified Tamlana]MDO6761272.1 heme-binding protein [Tamlana sp. 2_MG-2023]MDO6791755.1 heme-binding protein [Tamlana sp. 1_MG-2023]
MNVIKLFRISVLSLTLVLSSNTVNAQISNDISHDEAFKALLVAKKKAEKDHVLVNIAVVDAGANLKAFIRMDESFLGSIDVAIKKAKTARYFNIDTGKLGEWTQPGGIIYNIEHSNGGLMTFPGGIPIKDKNNKIIGAIGVSGGTIDQDRAIAKAGATAILE